MGFNHCSQTLRGLSGRSRAPCLLSECFAAMSPAVRRFPDSPHQTGRATFTASGFPEVGLPPRNHFRFVIRFEFAAPPTFQGRIAVTCRCGPSTSCGSSPCGRLSRPPTTMTTPTLPRFLFPTAGNICYKEASHVQDDGLCKAV